MKEFDELSNILIDSAPAPPGLADLALAGRKKRARQRAGIVGGIGAIGLLVAGVLLPFGGGSEEVAATGSGGALTTSPLESVLSAPSRSTTATLRSTPALSEDCAVPVAGAEDVVSLSPVELSEIASQISTALGSQLTGIYRDASGIVVTGTAAQEPAGLSALGGEFGVSVTYQQVGASQGELVSASQWLTGLMVEQLGQLDLRSSYVDPRCGAVVAIVGTEADAKLIRDRAAIDGIDDVFLILVRPDYVVALRGPATSEDSD